MSDRKPTVLIIEDDPSILFGLRDNFELAGYQVSPAVEGSLGLQLACSERPDLLLLDIMLPGLNGFEGAKHRFIVFSQRLGVELDREGVVVDRIDDVE